MGVVCEGVQPILSTLRRLLRQTLPADADEPIPYCPYSHPEHSIRHQSSGECPEIFVTRVTGVSSACPAIFVFAFLVDSFFLSLIWLGCFLLVLLIKTTYKKHIRLFFFVFSSPSSSPSRKRAVTDRRPPTRYYLFHQTPPSSAVQSYSPTFCPHIFSVIQQSQRYPRVHYCQCLPQTSTLTTVLLSSPVSVRAVFVQPP